MKTFPKLLLLALLSVCILDLATTVFAQGLFLSQGAASAAFSANSAPAFIPPIQPANSTPSQGSDCVAPPAGLVGWWKGDNNMLDSIGGHNGTAPNGMDYTDGVVGQAFSFNGTNSYVEVPDSVDLQLTNDLTIEFWVKRKQINGRPYGDIVVEKGGDWTSGVENYGVGFGSAEYGNLLQFFFANGNRGCTGINDLNWHYCAVVVHNGDVDPTFYLDGVQQPVTAREGASTINLYPSTAPLHIGAQIDPRYIYYSDTVIDELSIYSRALSQDEITAIYNAGSAGKCSSPAISTNDCVAPPVGLVSWWKGEGNALDSSGTNNGALQGGAIFALGEVGQAFFFNSTNASIMVPASASLDVGAGNGFTLEAWINPADIAQDYPLFEWNDSTGWGVHFHIAPGQPFNTSPGPGELYANIVDSDGGWHQLSSPSGVVASNLFQHVALTYDKASGLATIYCNGQIVGQQNLGSFTPLTTYNLYLGRRPETSNDPTEIFSFSGLLDEPSIYNRALSQTEIQSIYNAGSAGKCPITITNNTRTLINVDFGGGGIRPSAESGPAAVGLTSTDFWNFYTRDDANGNWLTFGSLFPLKLVDGTITTAGLTVANAPGDWGNGSVDPMFNDYIYPFDGGNVTVTITNLTPGTYDLYAYSSNSKFDVASGSVDYGIRSTYEMTATNPPVWVEGSSYVRYTNVIVTAGQPIVLTALPLSDVANISGLQIISSAASTTNATTPNNPPTIISQPLNQTVLQGSNATFSVTATGSGSLTYQWKFNKANISKATNATLTLTNLHPAQAGSYTVTISNPYGTATSSNALLAVTAQNALVYNYSGNEKVTTAKQEFSYNFSGEMFFLPGGTNGVFVGWASISGKKQYWVSPFSDYLLATIPGAANHTYTILGKAGNNVDANGQPHIWSYLHKGQNTTLAISNKKTFSFPDTFTCNDSQVYPDLQTGVMILREATSTYTYASLSTQSANNNGRTLADLVNALTQALVKQGYKPQ